MILYWHNRYATQYTQLWFLTLEHLSPTLLSFTFAQFTNEIRYYGRRHDTGYDGRVKRAV